MRLRIVVSTTALFLLVALIAAQTPQGNSGAITGTVRNASGALLGGVSVVASGPFPSAEQRTVVTNARGTFSIASLRPGTYRLEFRLKGFVTHVRQDVIVARGGKVALTIAMRAGADLDVCV